MKKNNKNNKGFSLVELIIVIAIMAILIGVLAPQYLKFVERSRVSTDKQNVDEIVRAVEIYAADPETTLALTDNATVTLNTTDATISGDTSTFVAEALKAAGFSVDASNKVSGLKLKSSKWTGNQITIVFTNNTTTDGINVTVTPSDAAE